MIDSHAHYSHAKYDNTYWYLTVRDGRLDIVEGSRDAIFAAMKSAGITAFVEPAIGIESNPRVLKLAQTYRGFAYPAVGVHPTRTHLAAWSERGLLAQYARNEAVVAIGETGLDYHHPRAEQHRLVQKKWFRYQMKVAASCGLPLILHIRAADREAIAMLRRRRRKLSGGVVHCFYGDWATAKQYVDMGLYIGIGGGLLQSSPRAEALRLAVREIPLDRVLLETDAPYVLPDLPQDLGKTKNVRNSSLLITQVAAEIARIKGISVEEVHAAATANTRRLFGL